MESMKTRAAVGIFTIACQSGCLPIDWEANQQRNNDLSCGTSSRKLDSDILSSLTDILAWIS